MVIQIRPGMPRRKRFQHRKKVEKEKRKERQKFSIPAPSQLQSPSEDPESSLQQISSALAFPCKEWSNQSPADLSRLQICKIPQSSGSSSEPLRITFNITVNADLSWSLFVHDHKVTTATCSSLETFDEQLKAASVSDPRQVRWHPVLIKWCLNLKMLSSSSYHALRSTGFIKLPSERTLLDYTHYFTNKVGFQDEVNQQLVEEVRQLSLPDTRKFVALLIDEMKVKEGLVYNKHTGEIVCFTSLGDINDTLLQIEQEGEQPQVAKQLLTLMVRGIMFKLNFPYAHFASRGATGDILFPLVWEAIHRLESSEIKVLCVTADGASANRKFFRMHHDPNDPTSLYKTKNHYAPDGRSIYFVADPPHLIKTIRNCWSHSSVNGTRLMQVPDNSCLLSTDSVCNFLNTD